MTDARPEVPAARAAGPGEAIPPKEKEIEAPAYGWFGDKEDQQSGALTRLGNRLGEMLSEVLGNAAVLEVKTYTSEDLQAIAGGEALHASGARLRAYTRCKLDGDTEVCVPVTAGGAVDQALWTLHVEMVKQAQDHRAELLKTVLSLFSSRVGK